METNNAVRLGNHDFEMVECVPAGYVIWNIGKNMPDGFLPLVRTGGYDGCQVVGIKKAIKADGAQIILAAVGAGPKTVSEMEQHIKKYSDRRPHECAKMCKALPFMRTIKGL